MAEYNNSKEQTTFISTDNNQLEVIMKQNTTFTIEKNKFNKKYAKSVQIRKTYIFFNMKIQYYKDVSSS